LKSSQSPECRRCGTCCAKGGPALHRSDLELVRRGTLPAAALYTLRKGELAWDPIRRCLQPLQEEIIKIKSRKTAACHFLAMQGRRCDIYADRPLECRVLTCWDVAPIEAIYARERLVRRDLLCDVEDLWEFIELHEERCAFALLARWANAWHGENRKEAGRRLAEIIGFDNRLRRTAVQRGIDPQLLDFLFGRPLAGLFEAQFGIRICSSAGKGPFLEGH